MSTVVQLGTPGEQRGVEEHPSYHGIMNKATAETVLAQHKGNFYLTRYSLTRETYVLSLLREKNRRFKHFKLIIRRRGGCTTYEIEGTKTRLTNVFRLLDLYADASISWRIDGIGQCLECSGKQVSLKNSDCLCMHVATCRLFVL